MVGKYTARLINTIQLTIFASQSRERVHFL